jgi:hypothetical protein
MSPFKPFDKEYQCFRVKPVENSETLDMKKKGKIMANLLRVSKANETPGFPLRSSTLYKWLHCRKHPELFVRLGGAVYVNLDRLDSIIARGGTVRKGAA